MSPSLDELRIIHLSIPKLAQFAVRGKLHAFTWTVFSFYPPSDVRDWPTQISEVGNELMSRILQSEEVGKGGIGRICLLGFLKLISSTCWRAGLH